MKKIELWRKKTLIRKRINDGFIRRKGRDQGGGEGLTVIVVRWEKMQCCCCYLSILEFSRSIPSSSVKLQIAMGGPW